jgi:anaerobic magnesium-protoporphyrin IX monomethyl ester cyclase
MKVLFVYPNVGSGHSIHMQPGLSSLSAVLKQARHHTALIDISQPVDREEFQAQVKAFDPDLVGFSVTVNQWRCTREYAGYIREVSNASIVCGGYHPTLVPEEVVEDPNVDWVIRGEGEEPLLEFMEALEHNRSLDDIANLWGGPRNIRNPIRPPIPDLDVLPFLDWDIFNNDVILPKAGGYAELSMGRGCPNACTYCCNPQWNQLYRGKGSVVRKYSVPRAIAELRRAVEMLHPSGFQFYDEVFAIKKSWVKEFCTQYKDQIGIPFQILLRVDMVDDEIMEMLKDAGCAGILAGVEAGEERFRKDVLNRQMSNDDIRWFFRKADELGFLTFAFVIFGFPKETPRQMRETIRLIKEIKPNHVQSTIFYPFPKTPLCELAQREGFLRGEQMPSAMTDMSILHQPRISPRLLKKNMNRIRLISLQNKIDKQQIGLYDFVTNFKHAKRETVNREFTQITIFGEFPGDVVTIVAHPPSTITYRLTIPEGGVLRTAVGLNPEVWNKREGDAVRFSIALDDGSETQELMSKVINPKYNAEDQKWHPVEVPLDRWAGKKVRLSFITRPDPSDNSYSWAGWARPHIARSSDLKPWYFIYTGSKTAN